MAEDLREQGTDTRRLNVRRTQIVAECKRQWESCLYTSTSLYEWFHWIRFCRKFYIALPIVLGGAAGVLVDIAPTSVVAVLAFLAGLIPAIADALKIQTEYEGVVAHAAEYKALQDRFRRIAFITAASDLSKAEADLAQLMDRMDLARASSLIPPESFFLSAREKIKAGHYDFEVDGPTFAASDDGDHKPS